MQITISDGTNAKAQRVTRIRVEISDHDLARLDGNPDLLLRVVSSSRTPAPDRLDALAELGRAIVKSEAKAAGKNKR